jgi:ATP-dependent DNA helicase PIF1
VDEQLLKLHRSGETVLAIANALGRSTRSIRMRIERLGPATKVAGANADEFKAPVDAKIAARTKEEDAIPLGEKQAKVVELIRSGRSVFFTGSAGTGKSFVLMRACRELDPATTFITATTGLAALNVGGTTIHSFSGVGLGEDPVERLIGMIRGREEVRDRWTRCKTLVIDEVSMLHGALFDKLERIACEIRHNSAPFGGIQLVLCGDFFQLPPVMRGRSDGFVDFCFLSKAWKRCVTVEIEMNTVYRQTDADMVRILNELRVGHCSPSTIQLFRDLLRRSATSTSAAEGDTARVVATRLYSHNADVDRENSLEIARLPGEARTYVALDRGGERAKKSLDACRAKAKIVLKVNAQVILIKNLDPRRGLVNGSRGVVVGFAQLPKLEDPSSEATAASAAAAAAAPPLASKNGDVPFANNNAELLPRVRFLGGEERLIGREVYEIRSGDKVVGSRVQLPLALGWAGTIHGSQGMTLDSAKLSLANCFEYGQVYTSFSRLRSWNGLELDSFDETKIRAHPEVVKFYQRLSAQNQALEDQSQALENQSQVRAPQPPTFINSADAAPTAASASGATSHKRKAQETLDGEYDVTDADIEAALEHEQDQEHDQERFFKRARH